MASIDQLLSLFTENNFTYALSSRAGPGKPPPQLAWRPRAPPRTAFSKAIDSSPLFRSVRNPRASRTRPDGASPVSLLKRLAEFSDNTNIGNTDVVRTCLQEHLPQVMLPTLFASAAPASCFSPALFVLLSFWSLSIRSPLSLTPMLWSP